ncbi:SDR family oxidoreductase [Croceitalea sp. MTPC9]|uniref:SDR family oxidoreductase n=1 Tax=unclassified Croceitalea TaxID=2632280 RepID=UPI002B374151|nr:SDR family oxidoreductase [Croceitalea sp. MTPC6]GMN15686.1 SDR family oxidoreductase [Croceitalea sp. MTPC9]
MEEKGKHNLWALILGGSSGLGLATAKKLGKEGYQILIVHRDRKSDLDLLNKNIAEITLGGARCESFNVDATNPERQQEVLQLILQVVQQEKIKVLVHSIAKGNLKPMKSSDGAELLNQDFQLTINAMALSLYDWVKLLVKNNLFSTDARVISFTSEGNSKAWRSYAAVSAAKVALEAITRNIALEFASKGIKANCIQAGVTETKSMRMIPNSDKIVEEALKRNPNGRLTTPEDAASAAYLLTTDDAKWITGTIIKVDGGESLR